MRRSSRKPADFLKDLPPLPKFDFECGVQCLLHLSALYAYFDRDNVGLKGFAKFFNDSSLEERGHAEKFIEYQNKRGGRVKLQSILMPFYEFDHEEKGEALYGKWIQAHPNLLLQQF